MTLEDILEIDTCPFDETVLEAYIMGDYIPSTLLQIDLCNLIIRYLNLFWEKYQPDLIRTYTPNRIVGVHDEGQDECFAWGYEAMDIMHTTILVNGWKCINLHYESGDIECYDGSGGNRDEESGQFHTAYMEFLDKIEAEGFARKLLENEEELMKDAVSYTESAVLGILWNEKLSSYNELKKQNTDMIQEACKEEDFHISRLEQDIWMPFWLCFAGEKRECDGEEYGTFLLGNDGYNDYYYDRFDPNWVCRTFVMDQLLDIALKKLEDYIAAKKQAV